MPLINIPYNQILFNSECSLFARVAINSTLQNTKIWILLCMSPLALPRGKLICYPIKTPLLTLWDGKWNQLGQSTLGTFYGYFQEMQVLGINGDFEKRATLFSINTRTVFTFDKWTFWFMSGVWLHLINNSLFCSYRVCIDWGNTRSCTHQFVMASLYMILPRIRRPFILVLSILMWSYMYSSLARTSLRY